MLSTRQLITYGNRLLRLRFLPFAIVYAVFHFSVKILASSVEEVEGHLGLVIDEHLLFQIDTQ